MPNILQKVFRSTPIRHLVTTLGGMNSNAPYWSLGSLNHVAIATPNLDKSSNFYAVVMKAQVSAKTPLPDHGVTTVFVDLGNTKIELCEMFTLSFERCSNA
jgi:methylmalonyl-CoA/ethylmalonyl-CoA epimerase